MKQPTEKRNWPLILCLSAQAAGLSLYGYQFFVSVFGITARTSWMFHEIAEVSALLALVVGVVALGFVLRRYQKRQDHMQSQLDAASDRFGEVIKTQFAAWDFTDAEAEIGLLLIKGLSIAEIAEGRGRSQATVKAQNTAIYQKSGLANRSQLVSYFVGELTSSF